MDSSPPTPAPPTCYYFFRICMDYTLCVPHFCVKLKNTKQKRWQKHYRGQKNYVGEILITSFKLPVLSCSQLLKITGLKKTIYNVLALDRCSTCVTVLIYETKMVTVNYVFLCAFFLFVLKWETVSGTRRRPALVPEFKKEKKKRKKFCFWWSIKKRFRKRREKWGKKVEKCEKYKYIFFLKQYISVWLVIEHFLFLGNK